MRDTAHRACDRRFGAGPRRRKRSPLITAHARRGKRIHERHGDGDRVLERGPLRVEIGLAPLSIHVRRAGRRLLRALTVWACEGEVRDRFVQVTEGVIADERLGFPERAVAATVAAADERSTTIAADAQRRAPRRAAHRARRPRAPRARAAAPRARRCAWRSSGTRAPRSASPGSARATRCASTTPGARSSSAPTARYTGPDCPPDLRELGGIPQGDYAPAPFLQSSRGYALWCETYANGTRFELDEPHAGLHARRGRPAAPARAHRPDARRPPAPLRPPHRPAGAAAALGLRLLEVARRLPAPGGRRGGRPRLPLARHPARRDRPRLAVGDAIQHLGAQPAPVPGLRRDGRSAGARPACAPWCGSRRGSTSSRSTARSRPTPARAACTASRRPTTSRSASSATPTASRTSRAGGWARARWSTSPTPRARRGGARRPCARCAWAWRGSRPTTARATTSARTCASPTGRRARRPRGATAACTARSMQRALDEAHGPGRGVLFGRSGWSGQQADRDAVGAATRPRTSGRCARSWPRASPPRAAASRTGRTTSAATSATALVERCPKELLLRWVQLGCFTPLMQAHGRLEQEPWTYDRETLELYRGYVLLHEMLNPYCAPRRPARPAAGRRSSARASLLDPAAGRSPTRSGSGPRSGSRRSSRRERASATRWLPPGEWIEAWSGARVRGGREVPAPAPLHAIPVWVRARRDRRHPPGRVRARRARRGSTRRCTRRCGASRAAGARSLGWPTGRSCGGVAGAGRPHGRADVTFERALRRFDIRAIPAGHGSSRGTYSFARKCRQIQGCVRSSASRPPSCAPARCARWAARASRRTTR